MEVDLSRVFDFKKRLQRSIDNAGNETIDNKKLAADLTADTEDFLNSLPGPKIEL